LLKFSREKYFKLGILGGTFDPPHKGHLYISKVALKKLKLDKIIWLITKQNPLKPKPYLNIKTRKKLAKKIIGKQGKIFIKFLDNKVKSSSTYKILKYFKTKNKKAKLYFIIGADNLVKFDKWYNWKKIPKIAKIIVFPRKDYSLKNINPVILKRLGKKDLIYVKTKKINISSSLIRKFW